MRERTEILKGVLEGCVMEIISEAPIHGYDILRVIRETGFEDVAEGSVYAILLRLERRGLAEVRAETTHIGPQRRVFSLTTEGRKALERFWKNWDHLAVEVSNVRGGRWTR